MSAVRPATRERTPLTLCVPDRESYLNQIAKFLTFNGLLSWIWPSAHPPVSLMPGPTHHIQRNDLSVCLLHLLELTKVVPEAGLGDHIVGREDPHAAVPISPWPFLLSCIPAIYALELRGSLRLGGELPAHNRVLGESAHPTESAQHLFLLDCVQAAHPPIPLPSNLGSVDSRPSQMALTGSPVVCVSSHISDIAPTISSSPRCPPIRHSPSPSCHSALSSCSSTLRMRCLVVFELAGPTHLSRVFLMYERSRYT